MRAEPTITTYRDGPYLVRGPIRLIDEDGRTVEMRRAIVPLCRCGRSRTKPLCDGSHGARPGVVPRADAQAATEARPAP